MRDFVRAIRAALRALKTWVWRVVDGALQLVQTGPPGGEFAEAAAEGVDAGQANPDDRAAKLQRIRSLALELVRNPDVPPAELMRGIGPVTASWLAAMSDKMLLRIVTAKDDELADHLTGRRSIRGVLVHEGATIADYNRVIAQDNEDEPDLDLGFVPAI